MIMCRPLVPSLTAVVALVCLGPAVTAGPIDPVFKNQAYIGRNFTPSVHLHIAYHSAAINFTECCATHSYPAKSVPWADWKNDTVPTTLIFKDQPVIHYHLPHSEPSGSKYMFLMVDALKETSPFGNPSRPAIHWQVANIPGNHVTSGDNFTPYAGPGAGFGVIIKSHTGPGPIDFVHNYYFLLYRQSGHLDKATVHSYAKPCDPRLAGRCVYDVPGLVRDQGLTLLGAGGFSSTLDDYARFLTLQGGTEAPLVCRGVHHYSPGCQPGPIVG